MKKSLIKNVTSSLLSLCLIALVSVSCSSDDEKDSVTPEAKPSTITFTSIEADKTNAFIEETITLNLKGTGYTDVSVTTSNSKIKIIKVASSIYEISTTESTAAKIYVELKNDTDSEIKNIDLNFAEHGVKDFNTVEGIKVDTDKSSKVLSLLGEPEQKTDSSDGLSESWNYPSKGLIIIIVKSNTIVNQINMVSSNYYITKGDVKTYYTTYPYEIGNGWKVNTTTMETVVEKLGDPTKKNTSETSPTNRGYDYSNQDIAFRFYSDNIDSYTGKKIIYFAVY